jgi:hypothetical protein
MEPATSSAPPAPPEEAAARRRLPEELKLRRRTLESVLEQCQRALEMMHEADLGEAAEGAGFKEVEVEVEEEDGGGDEGAPPPPPSEADYEADEVRGRDFAVHINLGSGIGAAGSIDWGTLRQLGVF